MAKVAASSVVKSSPQAGRESLREKVIVAAVGSFVTVIITLGIPAARDFIFSQRNDTSLSPSEVAFQNSMWDRNQSCAVSPQPLWHEARNGRKMDATVCPATGDILVVMRDQAGKQIQSWADISSLHSQFDRVNSSKSALSNIFVGQAYAASRSERFNSNSQIAQIVLCNMRLPPDGRALRRRVQVGSNQCIEIQIDTYTGQVMYQRPIPCQPNCAINV